MRLTASDIVSMYRPTLCPGRVFLRHKGEPEAPASAFDELLSRLGVRHEQEHLATLGVYEDLSSVAFEERVARTKRALDSKVAVIYQAAFRSATTIAGTDVEIIGMPDFLILDNDNYVIRDSKLSRRIDEKNRREIQLQLQLYGWLYEATVGRAPKALEVHSGKNEIVPVPYDGGKDALDILDSVLRMKQLRDEPYEPVGWSKCGSCGYKERCWESAEGNHDIATVNGVDQSLARTLHDNGVPTRADLLAKYDATTLSELKRPQGKQMRKVGVAAESILLFAKAMEAGQEFVLRQPDIPASRNFVMFDLEGLPPQFDELDKIYLWGTQVFGEKPSEFIAAVAGFGTDGDKQGWFDFLANAKRILNDYGDIRFVHWADYEKTNLKRYVDRYGDPEGIAARVLTNLLDLLRVTEDSIILPLPSFSLKVVEKYVGFKRTQEEFGGDWSMAMYIEAVETNDEKKRKELMDEILKYNCEDLQATWAVLQWLQSKKP